MIADCGLINARRRRARLSLKDAPCQALPEHDKVKFFPPSTPAFAKKFCRESCSAEMREECLELALANEEPNERYGVWGGMSGNERAMKFGGKSA